MLLCARCAAEARVDAEQETFTCADCSHEQPISRVERGELEGLRHVSSVAGAYVQLDDFARTIGAPAGALAHTVSCNGLPCRVAIELDSGTPRGLEITAPSPGFPAITLTRESDEEIYAKERGVTREVQVGDARFDARVFIDSDAVDADVLTVLQPPAVRAAILILLQLFTEVRLHAGGIAATGARHLPGICEPDVLRRHLAALRVVAGAPRPLESTTAPRSTLSQIVMAYALSGVPLGGPLLGVALSYFTPVHAEQITLLPALVGIAVAALALWPLARVFRGHSRSHKDLTIARAGMLVGTPLYVMALVTLANGVLDRSPERTDVLSVTDVSHESKHDISTVTARNEDSDLGAVSVDFKDRAKQVKVGQRVTVYTRAGALGVRWMSHDARLEIGNDAVLIAE